MCDECFGDGCSDAVTTAPQNVSEIFLTIKDYSVYGNSRYHVSWNVVAALMLFKTLVAMMFESLVVSFFF